MQGTLGQLEYRTSHPWIAFERVDLREAGADLWMLMGEARSKVEHLAQSLLKPVVAAEMLRVSLAKGARATTAIEGNTLSQEQVEEIVRGTHSVPPSQEYLVREIENIVAACNTITDDLISGGDDTLTPDKIKSFNRQVLDGLDMEEGTEPGMIRTHSVVVGPYRGAPAGECEYLLGRLCGWLNGPDFSPPNDDLIIPYALVKAVVAHVYVAWIHPFGDGNGRTARLMELQILLAAGAPMPAAHLLSNHYNQTRSAYYRELGRTSSTGGNLVQFLHYAVRGFVDEIRQQLDIVWEQLYVDRWEQYVYETFGGTTGKAADRRRRLVLAISDASKPVLRRDLWALDPELAREYEGTQRTLSRDLRAAAGMGLLESGPDGWTAPTYLILGFRPLRRET